MSHGIVIIGSGFAARQLVKNIRKQDANVPLTLIAADSMDEYNKPDLSHVISQSQRADDLTRQSAGEFAEQFNLRLFPHTWVTDIDADAHVVKSQDKQWQYDKLVLATGASAFVPPKWRPDQDALELCRQHGREIARQWALAPLPETTVKAVAQEEACACAAAAAADLGPSMQCSVCQWIYDPAKGEPLQDVAPGTPWSEVPDNFLCPECSLGKDVFDVLATEAK